MSSLKRTNNTGSLDKFERATNQEDVGSNFNRTNITELKQL